jgi:hypothetical protein
VALERLDDHLKAILKVKLREFVHLSPCFVDIPSIDVSRYARIEASREVCRRSVPELCPNRHVRMSGRRRVVRPLAHN